MNKKLIVTILLFITNFIIIQSGDLPNQFNPIAVKAFSQKDEKLNITTLDEMQQGYASKSTYNLKSEFINQILAQDDITLEQKIINLENLIKIINADISLHSGWLWNEATDQKKINWLYEKRSMIDRELKDTKWKASSFGYQVTVKAATMTSYYFMVILLAYVGQYQYAKITGDKTVYSFGALAAMPITTIIELASLASIETINALTSPTTQNILKKIYTGVLAASDFVYDYLTDVSDAITTTVPDAAQKGINNISQTIVSKIKPTSSNNQATQTESKLNSGSYPLQAIKNYVEEKRIINQVNENTSKNKKLIEQKVNIEKNKAIAEAIQNNQSDDPRYNPLLQQKLRSIDLQRQQEQAQLDLQKLMIVEKIEKGTYKKS